MAAKHNSGDAVNPLIGADCGGTLDNVRNFLQYLYLSEPSASHGEASELGARLALELVERTIGYAYEEQLPEYGDQMRQLGPKKPAVKTFDS